MRILHVAAGYPSGPGFGVHRYAAGLAEALLDLGHECHTVGLAPVGRSRAMHRAAESPYPFNAYNEYLQAALEDLPLAGCLARAWDEAGPFDVLVAHDWAAGLAASVLQKVHGCPLVGFLHGTEVGRCGGKLTREQHHVADMERWFAQRTDALAVPSDFVRREVLKHYQSDAQDLTVVPAGVSIKRAALDAEEFRATFAAAGEPLILFGGRFHVSKGPDLLIQAIPAVLAKRPAARFVIAGDGPMKEELQERVHAAHLDDHVRGWMKLGPVVMGALYRVADVAVVPSRYEAGGLAALEALAQGVPTVAASVGAMPEIANASGRLRLVPPESPSALATAVLQALEERRSDSGDTEERAWSSSADRFNALLRRWNPVRTI